MHEPMSHTNLRPRWLGANFMSCTESRLSTSVALFTQFFSPLASSSSSHIHTVLYVRKSQKVLSHTSHCKKRKWFALHEIDKGDQVRWVKWGEERTYQKNKKQQFAQILGVPSQPSIQNLEIKVRWKKERKMESERMKDYSKCNITNDLLPECAFHSLVHTHSDALPSTFWSQTTIQQLNTTNNEASN